MPGTTPTPTRRVSPFTSTKWAKAARRRNFTSGSSQDLPQARPGAGGVHHVAFRVRDEEYGHWADRLQQLHIPSSGPVDRFYFRSLYTRGPGGILYEIATDGPGFAADEPLESLGESLSLPPFLEAQRAAIEGGLAPL